MNDEYSIVGIDFGTSATVVKVKNYYEGDEKNDCHSLVVNGEHTIPTLVFEHPDGTFHFAKEALREYDNNSAGILHQNFKMDLISPDASIRLKAQKVTKAFFKFLYEEFDSQRGFLHVQPIVKTYVSYPAKWTSEMVSFMKQCAIDAGFGTSANVYGETEPTAAIFASLINHSELKSHRLIMQNKPINVMMLDMGAGTSDITIFKFKVDGENICHIGYNNQIINYPTADNSYLCGGREIDTLLTDYVMKYARKAVDGAFAPKVGLIEKITRQGIKSWKETNLSPSLIPESAKIGLPGFLDNYRQLGFFDERVPYDPIDRDSFKQISKSQRVQLYHLIDEAIHSAASVISDLNGPEDIDLVILTGGHSQWFYIDDYFMGRSIDSELPVLNFKKIIENPIRLIHESRPQETVANGLVYRDMNFEVAHTSANNVWLRISVAGQSSELMQLVSAKEGLPISKGKDPFKVTINENTFTEKQVDIVCDVYVGGEQATAIHYTKSQKFAINDQFLALLGLPFRIAGATLMWLFGDKPEEAFDDTYTITVIPHVSIDADGTGSLSLKYASNYNEGKYMFIIF